MAYKKKESPFSFSQKVACLAQELFGRSREIDTKSEKTVYESVREKFLDGKEVNRMPLMTKLCLILDYLWEMKPLYQERHSSQEIGE